MKASDIFALAYRTVRSNKLRTGITVAIIAFGIMALVGIITAIQAMNQKLTESFSSMGANAFTIRFKQRQMHFGNDNSDLKVSKKGQKKEKRSNLGRPITYQDAERFVAFYQYPATVGISTNVGNGNVVSFESRKTNPNVFLFGGDEHYLELNGINIAAGRNFTSGEVRSGNNSCLLGWDVARKLFPRNPRRAAGQVVRLNNRPYRVIGVLESRGSTLGFSRDNMVLASYRNIKNLYNSNSYILGVKAASLEGVEEAMGEAEAVFRSVRRLSTTEESNFVLERSDKVAETAKNSLSFLTGAVTIIGLITLIGAAIGLMNIMLVSVTERTKEVGLVKAIGGKSRTVRQQFLAESVLISIGGAVLGIILGVLVGNLFSMVLSTGFVVPWNWVLYGIIICTLVGLAAGVYPAWKAGRLNPIEALRYE